MSLVKYQINDSAVIQEEENYEESVPQIRVPEQEDLGQKMTSLITRISEAQDNREIN